MPLRRSTPGPGLSCRGLRRGEAEVAVDARPDLLQHGGFLHAGAIGGPKLVAGGSAVLMVA
jgi:acyl-coenzyme A thioesterase PaaI-like protein